MKGGGRTPIQLIFQLSDMAFAAVSAAPPGVRSGGHDMTDPIGLWGGSGAERPKRTRRDRTAGAGPGHRELAIRGVIA